MRILLSTLVAVIGGLAAGAVLACGQVDTCELSKPGASVKIRGYGYGFEGGDRPVVLRWAADRSIAATSQIDGNGDFNATITAPDKPGLHQLLVLLGDDDPAPVDVTVPVALPWYQDLASLPERALVASPGGVTMAVLAGGLLLGFWLRRRTFGQANAAIRAWGVK